MKSFTEKNNDRKPLDEILPAKMPLGICLEPTNKCNFKCVQCAASLPEFREITGEAAHIDMNLYEKIIRDIKAMGRLKNLNLYGDGEPFLNPRLIEMIRIAKANGIADIITVTTNGTQIGENNAEEIVNSGLDYLRVSIYSIYDAKLTSITKSKIKADAIFGNIAALRRIRDAMKSEKPFIYVKLLDTYSGENEAFLKKHSKIADQANIEKPMNWNSYKSYDLISQIDHAHKTDEALVQGYHMKNGCLASGEKRICTTPFLSLTIKVNGDVCICIVDWNRGTKVGNIADESLSDIWFGERLRKFREMHIRGRRQENVSCCNCRFLYATPDKMDHFTEEQCFDILNFKG